MLLIIAIVTMLVSWLVGKRLKSKFAEYSQTPLRSNLSGKEVAEMMLKDHQIYDVQVLSVEGQLTDHYDPTSRTVNLSHDVYYGQNAAATAVSAHECGHAVQHATAYNMLQLRSKMVPMVNISATVLQYMNLALLLGGGFIYGTGVFSSVVIQRIIAANLGLTLFSLVTLPVEFDASNRALVWLDNKGIVTSKEHDMAKDALKWAALTYVVAALGSLAQLMYWVMILMNRSDD